MGKKHLLLAMSGLASLMLLGSCQDEDLGYSAEQIAFRTNFEKAFSNYKDVETWDFSTYNLNKLGLEGGPSYNGQTRAGGTTTTPIEGRWFVVPEEIAGWLDSELKEKDDNREKGRLDFVLRMPDDHDILIIPIYQGQAGLVWNLGIKDEATGFSETIWEKSHGIETYVTNYNFTDTEVGDPSSYVVVSSDYNGEDELKLINAIPSFDPKTEWLKVTLSGMSLTGGTTGAFFINGNDLGQKWFKENVSVDIKDVNLLNALKGTDANFILKLYWKEGSFGSNVQVSVQRYKIEEGTSEWKEMKDGEGNYKTDYNSGHTIDQKIRSQALRVDHTKFSGYFSLYLDLQNLDDKYNGSNTFREHYASREIQSSTQGMMTALTEIQTSDEFASKVLKELKDKFWSDTKNILFLGCEDSDIPSSDGVPGSDWDMNDVVFLVVGISKENVRPKYEELIRKRYMIEDLGGTFDFDFNDIVIDLEQVKNLRNGTVKQKLSLKHLCGTIPWRVQVGEGASAFVSSKLPGRNNDCEPGGDGYDPTTAEDKAYASVIDVELPGSPWDPDRNNIIITSWPEAAGTDGWTDSGSQPAYLAEADGQTYTFAEKGEIPYIIACDPTTEWMKECTRIPDNWFSLWKKEIVKSANALAIQQSMLYLVKEGQDNERTRTLEYSTNSPAPVSIKCESKPNNATEPTYTLDAEQQKYTFTAANNTTAGDYTYKISQAATTYYEGKEVMLTIRVLNRALEVNNLTVTPDVISIEAGESGVVTYSNGGTGAISVDAADNVTTSINTTSKQITITVSENATPGSEIILHVRQPEDATYYAADKAVYVKVAKKIETVADLNNINSRDFYVSISQLVAAGATNDNSKITFNVTAPSNRSGWGCGEIYDFDDNKKYDQLKGPNNGTEWEFEFTLKTIKDWAGSGEGIHVKVWDEYNVTKIEVATPTPTELITNGDLEGSDYHNFKFTQAANNEWGATISSLISQIDGHGNVVSITANRSNNENWDTKFTIELDDALPAGSLVKIKFDYLCTDNVNINVGTNDASNSYGENIDELAFSTEWKTFEKTVTTTKSLKQIEMSLATQDGNGKTFSFDNISVIKDPN